MEYYNINKLSGKQLAIIEEALSDYIDKFKTYEKAFKESNDKKFQKITNNTITETQQLLKELKELPF